jgi:hypothetical protein
MRRRLATLAAVSVFALALGASPVFADSHGDGHGDGHGDHWVVTRSSSEVTGMSVSCGDHTYVATRGTSDLVVKMKGIVDPATGIATTAGQASETWTLNDVRVVDGRGRSHHVVGSQQIEGSWPAGADVYGNPGGPWYSNSRVVHVRVEGTRDGFSLVARVLRDGSYRISTSGTCDNPFDIPAV